MKTFICGIVAARFIGLIASSPQLGDPGYRRLLEARSIQCELREGTQASWDGGKLSLKQGTFGAGSTITFDSIDAQRGRARIIGNAGADDIVVMRTATGLTFVEQTAFGNVNITTVFGRSVGPAGAPFIAVSSRHQDINGPFPSQWHGKCRILQ